MAKPVHQPNLVQARSLWIPFGYTCIFVSLPSHLLGERPRRGHRTRSAHPVEYAVVLTHLAFDSADAGRNAQIRSAVAGELTKASSMLPPSISNSSAFKNWKSSLEGVSPQVLGEPAR